MAKKKRPEPWEEETRQYIERFHNKAKQLEKIKEYASKTVKHVAKEVPSVFCECGFLLKTCSYSFTKKSFYCPVCNKTTEGSRAKDKP